MKKEASDVTEEDQAAACEANNTTRMSDAFSEAVRNVDATAYDDYKDVDEPSSFPTNDANDDLDSIPHPIYDMGGDAYMVVHKDD